MSDSAKDENENNVSLEINEHAEEKLNEDKLNEDKEQQIPDNNDILNKTYENWRVLRTSPGLGLKPGAIGKPR